MAQVCTQMLIGLSTHIPSTEQKQGLPAILCHAFLELQQAQHELLVSTIKQLLQLVQHVYF